MLLDLVMTFLLVAPLQAAPRAPEIQMHLCGLERSDPGLAEKSFQAIYNVRFDEKGVPSSIERVTDPFLGEERAQSCFSTWRVRNTARPSVATIILTWRSGLLVSAYLGYEGAKFETTIDRK